MTTKNKMQEPIIYLHNQWQLNKKKKYEEIIYKWLEAYEPVPDANLKNKIK